MDRNTFENRDACLDKRWKLWDDVHAYKDYLDSINDPSKITILDKYIEQCKQEILSNWNPLPTLIEENPDLQVVLEVQIDANGTLSKPVIRQSSGNSSFDRSAIIALRKTKKLPIPPTKYQSSAAGGIIITIAAQDKPL